MNSVLALDSFATAIPADKCLHAELAWLHVSCLGALLALDLAFLFFGVSIFGAFLFLRFYFSYLSFYFHCLRF